MSLVGPTLCDDIKYIVLSDRNYVCPHLNHKSLFMAYVLHKEDENVVEISDQYTWKTIRVEFRRFRTLHIMRWIKGCFFKKKIKEIKKESWHNLRLRLLTKNGTLTQFDVIIIWDLISFFIYGDIVSRQCESPTNNSDIVSCWCWLPYTVYTIIKGCIFIVLCLVDVDYYIHYQL